ncbi:hypothetical protein [Paraburkholderia sp. BCC1885]|uniref:hypothetical protein n=1 Tax=Paraburkholderia sp. BCC1885 TaxID=2562669 RepID=UPI0021B31EF1|nr:hypothetical protein [Paraburkholderia sp. BCC1885]
MPPVRFSASTTWWLSTGYWAKSARSVFRGAVVAVAEGIDTQGGYHAIRFLEQDEQSVASTVAGAAGEIDALLDIVRWADVRLF